MIGSVPSTQEPLNQYHLYYHCYHSPRCTINELASTYLPRTFIKEKFSGNFKTMKMC